MVGGHTWWHTADAARITQIGGLLSGVVLFFGLGATFGVLAVVPVQERRLRWPLYPAISCLVFGLLIAAGSPPARVLWPLALVALGAFFLIRASASRQAPSEPTT